MTDKIKQIIRSSIDVKEAVLQDAELIEQIGIVAEIITAAYKLNRRVYFCGNGGSAADAQHLAAELTGRFYNDRKALPAEALHCNSSYLTAVSNDYGFDEVYARMIEGIAEEGDVLVGLSTSGNSPNILKAFEKAKEKKVITVAFTGAGGGALRKFSNYGFYIPSADTPRIQETHILIGHIICQLVEEKYFSV